MYCTHNLVWCVCSVIYFFMFIVFNLNKYMQAKIFSFKKNSIKILIINFLSAKITKWSNTLKQFVSNLLTNCLSAFDQFVGLALKGLREISKYLIHFFYMRYSLFQNVSLVTINNVRQVVSYLIFACFICSES